MLVICIKLWQSFHREVLFKILKVLFSGEKAVIFEKLTGDAIKCTGVEFQSHKRVKVLVVPCGNPIFLSIYKSEPAVIGRISVKDYRFASQPGGYCN